MIEEAGFNLVTYTNYTGGIVSLHSGYKIWKNIQKYIYGIF